MKTVRQLKRVADKAPFHVVFEQRLHDRSCDLGPFALIRSRKRLVEQQQRIRSGDVHDLAHATELFVELATCHRRIFLTLVVGKDRVPNFGTKPFCCDKHATLHHQLGQSDAAQKRRLPTLICASDHDGKSLIMITGANQGGKSTFLRSIGLAQLMMQCGMFVAAERFRAEVGDAIFTHYKREEDPTMTSGKLDEELSRMSQIVDIARPDSLLLFNESFSATNEREGAEIAGSIVQALLENDMKVCFVSHSFELAHRFHSEARDNALFLRAERQADGTRTFKLLEGEPLPTSFGEDLYQRVFKGSADDARVVV